ncbi:MAG: STAS domain-containing protein [Candidatus Omnitrophota bacterium]
MSLKTKIEKRGEGTYVIKAEGRLDTDTYTSFEEKIKPLMALPTKTLIFDMSALVYISSSGLGVIFNTKKSLEEINGSLIITNLQPQIRKVFEIIDALTKVNVFDSMREVESYLSAIQRTEVDK